MVDDVVWSDPPCRLLVRTKTNVVLYNVPERQVHVSTGESSRQLWQGSTTWSHCTPDGAFAYFLTSQGVVQCNLKTYETSTLQDTKSVQVLTLSPSGLYAVSWERQSESTPNNLKVFRNGQLLTSFPQKSFKRDAWPSLQFTFDEQYAFLLTTNEIRVYPVENLSQAEPRFTDKIRVPGISSFSLPPRCSKNVYLFTTFCAGNKDQPSKATLQDYRPSNSNNTSQVRMSKSLFQAEDMKTHWSPVGDAALITLQTSVDTSGQSYYGSSQLFLLSLANAVSSTSKGDAIAVPVQAPVLDVAWMPHPTRPPCFAVISGKMPAMTSLHDGQSAEPMFLFGNAHRNTIAWAPHGRFVTLAGFGNLAGGMGFWDRNKLKLIPHSVANARGELKAANATAFGWSPDSRLFFTATCSPRMNVENGIRLWRYTGVELTNVPWDNAQFQPDQLLQAQFIPALLETYPDRPQSPLRGGVGGGDQVDGGTGTSATAPPPPPPKTGAYVPPGARNVGAGRGTTLAERMRREKEGSMQQATKVLTAQTARNVPTVKVIPGMAPTTKSKSALKREKAKLKKQTQEEQVVHEQQDTPPAATSTVLNPSIQQAPQPPVEESQLDPEKRARKLKKILKQIEDLKQRSVDTLNDDQKLKLASEDSLRAELAGLGF